MKRIFVLLINASIISCSNNSEQIKEETLNTDKSVSSPDTTESPATIDVANTSTACYMKITGRDTAIIMIDQSNSGITGKMVYDNYEKDGSHGTVKGREDGDILKLYYDFNSEGMRSVMEVYFKKVPGGLIRGVGDMNVKGDTTYFTSGINYSDKEAFSKIDCDKVKEKFQ